MADGGSSALVNRKQLAGLAGQHFGGRRDLYSVMGYPEYLAPEDYAAVYLRQDVAARAVDAFPDATWREQPEMRGDDGFIAAWRDVEAKHQLWRAFHRLDRLTGLGHYGVLFLGLDGGEPTHTPARGAGYTLLYAQPHSERTAQVTQWEDDPASPRYGQPKMYRITTGVNWTGGGAGQKSLNVHHSRVLHVAERALEDASIGVPRLERVWNRLMDLDKLLGGSAEIYWQNSAMLLQMNASTDVEWEPEEQSELASHLEEMQHRLRRVLRTRGVDAQNLAPGLQGSDPSPHIEKQIDIVAGAIGIPKRILVGSEAGELASSQDENNWAGRIAERREQFAGPTVLEGFIGKAQRLGVLPGGYDGHQWPESDTLGEDARADIALKKAQAVATYANAPGAALVVTPEEFRSYLGEDGEAAFAEDDDLGDV